MCVVMKEGRSWGENEAQKVYWCGIVPGKRLSARKEVERNEREGEI